jgi:putative DNA primase/helicase
MNDSREGTGGNGEASVVRELVGTEIWYSARDARAGPFTLTQERESLSFDGDVAGKLGVGVHDVFVVRLAAQPLQVVQLQVDEKTSSGEIATQLHRIFTLVTTDDSHEMYYYRNGVYLPNADAALETALQEAYERVGLDEQPTKHFVSEVVGHLQRGSYRSRQEFDKDPDILNVRNGLFNMATGELQPHNPTYLSRRQLPVAYNPTAECPLILKFLDQVQPDEEDRKAVIEHASVPLLRSNFLQKAFMYVGKGRNGKSVWFEILGALYGADNVTHSSIHNLQWNRFAPATLDGKFANIHDDISTQEIRHTGIIKQIIGGNPIDAEHKGHPFFSMRGPHPILYFSANQLPEVEDLSVAWMRRWEYVDWGQEFKIDGEASADRQLVQKLTTPEELEGLLLTLIRAARSIRENLRLSRERTVDEVRDEWVRRSDITLAFFKATIDKDPDGFIPRDQLLAEYVEYCKRKNYSPKPARAVWEKLRDNYDVQNYTPMIDGQRVKCWKGIKHQLQEPQRTLPS